MPQSPIANAVLIAGPTASGKSALALALAERIGGAVINADSMQVYSELRVLTARPSENELSRAAHFLYGFVPAAEAYSAGRFVADAAAAMVEARARGLTSILVGGTGLYFKALTEGLAPIPPADPDVRSRWREEAQRVGAEALHDILRLRDLEMASRLLPQDAQRIVRALEVLDTTGRSLASWQRERSPPAIDEARAVRLVLNPDRGTLHANVAARLDGMAAAGALAEAAALMKLDLDPALPAMRAIGVRPFLSALRGDIDPAEALAAAKAETRQFVKRQQTWLRRHMISWKYVQTKDMESSLASAIAFIHS